MIPLETPVLLAFGAVAFLFAVVFGLLIATELRLKRLLRGKHAKDLEETLKEVGHELDLLNENKRQQQAQLKNLDERLRKSVREVGVVRFNPFKGTSGSNQSFAAAFINEEGNGTIISSLYSREQVSVFAKPLKNGQSEYELSKEEKEAIARASHGNP
ncbi:MAG: DUF4446 family protein [Parcubacteria group bacterium]|nr:DUF4446 family protein [Parcubacteria group bacterium]